MRGRNRLRQLARWQILIACLCFACQDDPIDIKVVAAQLPPADDPFTLDLPAGQTAAMPELGTDGAALFIEAPVDRTECFQLDGLVDTAGQNPMAEVEGTTNCPDCGQRAQPGLGSALVLVAPRPLAAATSFRAVRVSARDCLTGNPLPPWSPHLPLRLTLAPLANAPPPGATTGVRLAFYLDGTDLLDKQPGAFLQEVHAHVAAVFSQARIAIEVASICVFQSGQVKTVYSPGKLAGLRQVWATAKMHCPHAPGELPVVITGCLHRQSGIQTLETFPLGEVTHIPGAESGLVQPDFIALAGRDCGVGAPKVWSSWSLGQVLAHEIGHFLGLFHTVEADASSDDLSDTSAANLMNFNPVATSSVGLSPTQVQIMRRHPLLRGLLPVKRWPR